MRSLLRFERQPPGTAITRSVLVAGGALAAGAGLLVIAREPRPAAWAAGASGALLLLGGHRANHGAGGPTDRMLDDLLDRVWDGAVLSGDRVGRARRQRVRRGGGASPRSSLSFVAGYIRARGAALGYSVEERHVTRGARYALVVAFLPVRVDLGRLGRGGRCPALAAVVRAGQVAQEERAAERAAAGRRDRDVSPLPVHELAGAAPPGAIGPRPSTSGRDGCSTASRPGRVPSSRRTRRRCWAGRPTIRSCRRRPGRRSLCTPATGSTRSTSSAGTTTRCMAAFRFDGIEHVEKGLAEGKGVVIALPHTGNWDVGGRAMAAPGRAGRVGRRTSQAGAPVRAVPRASAAARDGHHRPGERRTWAASSRSGSRRTGSWPSSPTAISRAAGIEVEMFGRTRRMPAGPALIALSTGAPLLSGPTFTTQGRMGRGALGGLDRADGPPQGGRRRAHASARRLVREGDRVRAARTGTCSSPAGTRRDRCASRSSAPTPGRRPGGVQVHVRSLAARLRDRGHEVLGARADDRAAARALGAVGRPADQRPVPGDGRADRARPAYRRTRGALAEFRPDVVHVHEPLTPSASMFAALASTRAGRGDGPRLPRPVDRDGARRPAPPPGVAAGGRRRRRLRGAPRRSSGGRAERRCSRSSRTGSTSPAFASAEPRTDLPAGRRILWVNRLDAQKGFPVALAAFSKVLVGVPRRAPCRRRGGQGSRGARGS